MVLRNNDDVPRIIAGSAKGRRIGAPEGKSTRPTSDRAREALFSALNSQLKSWAGRSFLDLYAGSGAVGLEAASRGAARVVLVESDAKALSCIRSNMDVLAIPNVELFSATVDRYVQEKRQGFDVIFADPPFELPTPTLLKVLADLVTCGALSAGTVVVLERSTRDQPWIWPDGITSLRERHYGESTLWYGQALQAEPSQVADEQGGH